jgi:hypothetical protein
VTGIEPPSDFRSTPAMEPPVRLPFCPSQWIVAGYRHAFLKGQGHDGSCWCCEDYPGGNLSVLVPEDTDV